MKITHVDFQSDVEVMNINVLSQIPFDEISCAGKIEILFIFGLMAHGFIFII